jgi:hypothetical protein
MTQITTGLPTLDALIQIAGTLYLITSALAAVLPKPWRVTKMLARFAADLRGLHLVPVAAPVAAADTTPTVPPAAS